MRLQRGLRKLRSISTIKQPEAPKCVKGGNFPGFQGRYTPHYAFPITAPSKLAVAFHALKVELIDRYEKRPDPLWWFIVLSKTSAGSKKAILRKHLQRRVRLAFTKALKSSGYNKDGSKIPGVNKDGMELRGTANLLILPTILTTDTPTLEAAAKRFVKKIVESSKAEHTTQKDVRPEAGLKGADSDRFSKQSFKSPERKVTGHQVRPSISEPKGWGKDDSPKHSFKSSERERENFTRPHARPFKPEKEAGNREWPRQTLRSVEPRERMRSSQANSSRPTGSNGEENRASGNRQPDRFAARSSHATVTTRARKTGDEYRADGNEQPDRFSIRSSQATKNTPARKNGKEDRADANKQPDRSVTRKLSGSSGGSVGSIVRRM